ncbi:hypothetical protein [Usitatibacter palustris]|uniref:Haem-binding uptake, Tiki superfamily, ChaN n=1 Tax=Usitatibacter palustris TaxID=2732487 RepID=A0A6M4H518_9PROT|nr:hypothetical protein [Usitatibacter palustris]QJR14741.1 hypothetical protein DSM104440_01551 [Usitatibacter palustris]
MSRSFLHGCALAVGALVLASCADTSPVHQAAPPCCQTQLPTLHIEQGSGGALLYIGTRHTADPTDPQIEEIARLAREFRPTLVLNEGGNPPVSGLTARDDVVRSFGEMGFARWIASQAKLPANSVDPEWADEIAHVVSKHSPQVAKVFYAVRAVPGFRRNQDTASIEERVDRYLSVPRMAAVGGPPRTSTELAPLLLAMAPGPGDWREATVEWTSPWEKLSVLNDVARTSTQFREEYMVRTIVEAVGNRERVLVVTGRSHLEATRGAIESALRRAH